MICNFCFLPWENPRCLVKGHNLTSVPLGPHSQEIEKQLGVLQPSNPFPVEASDVSDVLTLDLNWWDPSHYDRLKEIGSVIFFDMLCIWEKMHLLHLAPLSPWKGKTSPVSDSCDPSMSPKTVKLQQCRTCRLPSHNFKNVSRFWTRDGEWEHMGSHGNLDYKILQIFWTILERSFLPGRPKAWDHSEELG